MRTKTSRAGEAPCGSSQSGFTLFEVLAVLTVVSVVIGALILVPRAGSGTAGLRSAAFGTAAILRQARSQAILAGKEKSVLIDLSRRIVRGGHGAKPLRIAKGIRVAMNGAVSERASRQASGVRFFPNGSSTGATLRFSHHDRIIHVRVNWLTGRVSIDADR